MYHLRIHIDPYQTTVWITWTTLEFLTSMPQVHFQGLPTLLQSHPPKGRPCCPVYALPSLKVANESLGGMHRVWVCGLGHPHMPDRSFSVRVQNGKRRGGSFSSPHASMSWGRTVRCPRITHSNLAFRSLGRQSYQVRKIEHILFITFTYTYGIWTSICTFTLGFTNFRGSPGSCNVLFTCCEQQLFKIIILGLFDIIVRSKMYPRQKMYPRHKTLFGFLKGLGTLSTFPNF